MKKKRTSGGRTSSLSKGEGATVKVVVRVRPANAVELKASSPPVVQVQSADNSITVVKGSGKTQQRNLFRFDHVFGTYATQKDIFDHTLSPIVDDVLSGVESTVFAYGQTGTGKTYTMEGDINDSEGKGVIPRAVEAIFEKLQNKKYVSSDVAVSFLEIYNEDLTDLLSNQGGLTICTNGEGKIVCKGLSQQPIGTVREVLRVLRQAQQRRQTGETKMNKQSSRSHCLFTLQVRSVERVGDMELERTGKLHLVDLAGSECAKSTGATGHRLRESQNINQSLLTLGRVISALRAKSKRIPYRDSKLTRLLSQALGGACRTCIIATVSPSALCAEESMSTLHYADRAHGIKNKAANANVRMSVNGGNGGISAQDSATFIEMQNRLDYMENQMLEAQTALARQHETNVALQKEITAITEKEAETQLKYDETCVQLAETRGTLAQTQADFAQQTSFTRSLQSTLRSSVETLVKFADSESEGREQLSKQVQQAIDQHSKTIDNIKDETSGIVSGIKAKNFELGSLLQDFSTTNIDRVKECIDQQVKMSSGLNKAIEGGFEKLNSTINNSAAVFENAESELAVWGKNTTDSLKNHLNALEEKLHIQEQKVIETTQFFNQTQRAQLEKFAERQVALNNLSKAAREHAKLGSQHLTSLEALNSSATQNLSKLSNDLESHLEFIATTRADRSRGQQDKELLASVEATTATLAAGAKSTLAALAVQRNFISSAIDYHKSQTADGVLKKKLEDFTSAFNGASEEQIAMLDRQIKAMASAIQQQMDGNIEKTHMKTINATQEDINTGITSQQTKLTSLSEYQKTAAKSAIANVMDGVLALITSEVMNMSQGVEERVQTMQAVSKQMQTTFETHKATLADETQTWSANNGAVVEAMRGLRTDSQAIKSHTEETKADVDEAVTGFHETVQVWGDANREVDDRMSTAIKQNDAMHEANNQLTQDLKDHIATTTSEANTWAETGNMCDSALATAGDAIKTAIDGVQITTADHGRNFSIIQGEANDAQTQAETNVENVDDVCTAVASAAKTAEDVETTMAQHCETIATQHKQFIDLNSEIHSSINDAVVDGMAPRKAVQTAIAQHKTEMQSTIEQIGLDTIAKTETMRACLKSDLDKRGAASTTMQARSDEILKASFDSVSASQGTIEELCADIVDKQLVTFDKNVGIHNTSTNNLVDSTLQAHAEMVETAISATTIASSSDDNSKTVSDKQVLQDKAEDAKEDVIEDDNNNETIPVENQKPETSEPAEKKDADEEASKPKTTDSENTAPKTNQPKKRAAGGKTAAKRGIRKSSRIAKPVQKSRVLRPRTRSSK